MSARRHQDNTIKSPQGTLRSASIFRKHGEPSIFIFIHANRAVRISNDLYGSDCLSAVELAISFSQPMLVNKQPIPVYSTLLAAHYKFSAERKLALILRSNVLWLHSFEEDVMV